MRLSSAHPLPSLLLDVESAARICKRRLHNLADLLSSANVANDALLDGDARFGPFEHNFGIGRDDDDPVIVRDYAVSGVDDDAADIKVHRGRPRTPRSLGERVQTMCEHGQMNSP